MSIRVEPENISDYADHRLFAYVISTKDDPSGSQVHVIAVTVEINGSLVDCSRVGGSTKRNIADNAKVTLIWPPIAGAKEYDDYTLIADGHALINDDKVIVTIGSAILHRPASS